MGLTCTTEPGSRGPWKWDVRVLVGAIGIGDPGERGQGGCYGVGQSVGIAGRAVLLVLKQKLAKKSHRKETQLEHWASQRQAASWKVLVL